MAPSFRGTDRSMGGSGATYTMALQAQNPRQSASHSRQSWEDWPQLKVKVMSLPRDISTWAVYQHFIKEGNVSRIKISDESRSGFSRTALVTFDPPPSKPFWINPQRLIAGDSRNQMAAPRLQLLPPERTFQQWSPFDKEKKTPFPERISLKTEMVIFGVFLLPSSIAALRKCHTIETMDNAHQASLTLDLWRKKIEIQFSIELTVYSEQKRQWVKDIFKYKIRIKLDQILGVHAYSVDNKSVLTLVLETPPKFFRKAKDVRASHDNGQYWEESRIWPRQTDIVLNRSEQRHAEFRLIQQDAVIDLGEWLCDLLNAKCNR